MQLPKEIRECFMQDQAEENILHAANALIHLDDLHAQKMIWGNDRFKEMLGFTSAEVIKMGNEYIPRYYHPDDIKKIPEIINFFKNNNGGSHTTLFRVKHKNGNWIYFYTTRSLLQRDGVFYPRYVVSVSINLNENINCGLMLGEFNKIRTAEANKETIKKFTKREKEIISLVSQGYTNTQIAEKLFISVKTVDNHRTRIFKKTKSHNGIELLNFVNDIGLLQPLGNN
jgi:PAS domain S-box-containing protein